MYTSFYLFSHIKPKNLHSWHHTNHTAFHDAIQWRCMPRDFRDTFSVTLSRCWFPRWLSMTLHSFPWHIPWRPCYPRQLFPRDTRFSLCATSLATTPFCIASSSSSFSIFLSQTIRIYCSWSETNKQTELGLSCHVITSHIKLKNVHSWRTSHYHNAFHDTIQWRRTSRGFRDTFSVTLSRCCFPQRIPWRPCFPRQPFPWHSLLTVCVSCRPPPPCLWPLARRLRGGSWHHTYHNAFHDAIQWRRTPRGFRDTFSVALSIYCFPWRIPWRLCFPRQPFPWHSLLTVCVSCHPPPLVRRLRGGSWHI